MHDGRQFLFSNMKDRIWNQPKRGKQSLFLTSEPRNEYSESFAAPKLSRESYNSETNLSKATLQFHYRSLHHLLMKGQPVDGQQRILSQTQRHFFLVGRIAILGPKDSQQGFKSRIFLDWHRPSRASRGENQSQRLDLWNQQNSMSFFDSTLYLNKGFCLRS